MYNNIDAEAASLLPKSDAQPSSGSSNKGKTAAVLAAGLLLGGGLLAVTGSKSKASAKPSRPPQQLASYSGPSKAGKVDVYIIAEAFCPNCKEHSYLLDQHVMSKGDDLRAILDMSMDMMVYDGWDSVKDAGECEQGKFDCILSQWHLAAQRLGGDENMEWWDFSRCVYKHQPVMIAKYEVEGRVSGEFLEEVVKECAEETSIDFEELKKVVSSRGNHLLHESYGRTIEYGMPVWIYVNGKYIEYEQDWLSSICAAYTAANGAEGMPKACEEASSLEGGDVALTVMKESFEDNDKVDVYIVAEAMCPNCKEHSYYFDNLVMSPDGTKSHLRNHINLKMEQMVIDGWSEEKDAGICEKGKWDCVMSKYHLCGELAAGEATAVAHTSVSALKWWDYSRCLYKNQPALIEYYYAGGSEEAMSRGPHELLTVHEKCAADADVDSETIKSCVSEDGTALLKASYERVKGMGQTDPVWIFVEGQRIGEHEDWLSAICAALIAKGKEVEECSYYADV